MVEKVTTKFLEAQQYDILACGGQDIMCVGVCVCTCISLSLGPATSGYPWMVP